MKVIRGKFSGDIQLIGFSDQHIGAKTCNKDKLYHAREYILKNNVKVFDLGDLLELATRYSVGAGVYEQVLNPDEQIDKAIDFYEPIAKKGLLLAMTSSNHHARAFKEVGIDITKQIARILRVPYVGHSGFLYLRVGKQTYIIFGHH